MTDKKTERRKFLRNAVVGGVAVAATAGVANKIVKAVAESGPKGSDFSYLRAGDMEMSKREYVEMSGTEKAAQIRMLVDNYKYEAV